MINKKCGSTAIANLISVIISVILIVAIGVIYYIFFSPSALELEEIEYVKIDKEDYQIDQEFESGLDSTIDFNYTDDDLDMHRDLKDYYQGREDPFAASEDRNTTIDLDSEKGEKVTNSRPDLAPPETDEEEVEIDLGSKNTNTNSSILNF